MSQIGGAKAQKWGVDFEKYFESICIRNKMAVTKFPDGCKQVGGRRIIRVKTPCDWILSFKGRTFMIDTKTTQGNTFSHSQIVLHQIYKMREHASHGTITGYVIYLRGVNEVLFINAWSLARRVEAGPGSIKHTDQDVVRLGPITSFDPWLMVDSLHTAKVIYD